MEIQQDFDSCPCIIDSISNADKCSMEELRASEPWRSPVDIFYLFASARG